MASIASLAPVRERRTPRSLSAVCFPFLSIRAAPSCILGRRLLRRSGFFLAGAFRGFLWIPRILTELRSV